MLNKTPLSQMCKKVIHNTSKNKFDLQFVSAVFVLLGFFNPSDRKNSHGYYQRVVIKVSNSFLILLKHRISQYEHMYDF